MVTTRKLVGTQIFYWRFKMSDNLTPPEQRAPTIGQMVRMTAENTAQFMAQIADHIDQLETKVAELSARITAMEGNANASE